MKAYHTVDNDLSLYFSYAYVYGMSIALGTDELVDRYEFRNEDVLTYSRDSILFLKLNIETVEYDDIGGNFIITSTKHQRASCIEYRVYSDNDMMGVIDIAYGVIKLIHVMKEF